MSGFSYTRILAISTAALVGVTFGTFQNQQNKKSTKNAKIIDYHCHMMSPPLFEIVDARRKQLEELIEVEPNLNGTQLIEQMKQLNIAKSLVVSSAYLFTSETAKYLNYNQVEEQQVVEDENNYIYNECRKYPKQLIPSFSIHPLKSYSIEEVHRCLKQNNNKYKVCKLHFSNSNVDLRNAEHLQTIKSLFRTISQYNGCILLHFDNCYIDNIEFGDTEEIKQYVTMFMNECVIPYKHLKIVFAHLGGFGGFDKRTADIFESILSIVIEHKLNERIFFDISSVFFDEKPIEIVPALEEKERLTKLLNIMEENNMLTQLVYGSDYPFVEQIQYVTDAREQWPLSQQTFDEILNNDSVFSAVAGSNNRQFRIFKS